MIAEWGRMSITQKNIPTRATDRMPRLLRAWTNLNLGEDNPGRFEVINLNQRGPFFPAG